MIFTALPLKQGWNGEIRSVGCENVASSPSRPRQPFSSILGSATGHLLLFYRFFYFGSKHFRVNLSRGGHHGNTPLIIMALGFSAYALSLDNSLADISIG
jgi:hypothetical protein